MDFSVSNMLRQRVQQIIPGGAHTYSKGDDQFPELSPGFIVKGKGARVWDPDGNMFVDWGMGLRSVTLGHAYEPVLCAVREQLELGSNFTRPSVIEQELAQLLVDIIPSAEMVKFAKNGSDVTSAAVRLARAYTGKDIVLRCADHPFFSVNDWFIGDTVVDAGIPSGVKQYTKNFSYNDTQGLEAALTEFSGHVACIVMEMATTSPPKENFLQQVRALADKHGTLLIFDEIITGFRWDMRGAQQYYNVIPDLATFGKGMANGFSCAALAGKREIMMLGGLEHPSPRVFLLSTTNGGETHSLAAAIATIREMTERRVIEHMWRVGEMLMTGFNAIAREFGVNKHIEMIGYPCSPAITFLDRDKRHDAALRSLFLQETIREGVLIPYVAPSYAHGELEVEQTLQAVRNAMPLLRKALERGDASSFVVGSIVKPVFRRFN
jgi:glutamate-1-semialdehyde 2,1-aminomutase